MAMHGHVLYEGLCMAMGSAMHGCFLGPCVAMCDCLFSLGLHAWSHVLACLQYILALLAMCFR